MLWPLLLHIALVWLVIMSGLFVLSIIVRRNDIADVAWGLGVAGVGWAAFVSVHNQLWFALLPLGLASAWGLRLAVRIGWRNLHKSEDARYRAWREQWGRSFYLRSYFQVYLLQGALMLVVGYVLIHAQLFAQVAPPAWLLCLGIVMWLVGLVFEVVGDAQLDHFLRTRTDTSTIMSTGLWRYSRHPNYFGEIMMWWGIWCLVATSSYGLFALVSPLAISFLIIFVSGVPLAEAQLEHNPAYQAYKARTSVLVPWFVRSADKLSQRG